MSEENPSVTTVLDRRCRGDKLMTAVMAVAIQNGCGFNSWPDGEGGFLIGQVSGDVRQHLMVGPSQGNMVVYQERMYERIAVMSRPWEGDVITDAGSDRIVVENVRIFADALWKYLSR